MPTPAAAPPATSIPHALRPPIDVALARASDHISTEHALSGGAQYEPKWDGFRLVIIRDGDHTTAWSRQGTNLTAAFPDLIDAARQQLPPGVVVDGEAVIWQGGRLDFDALQRRLVTRTSTIARLARQKPAVFVAFDLLAVAGHDLREQPLRTRRALLEALAVDWTGALQLSPASTDIGQAREWFEALPATGIEGLVVKGRDQPYLGGQRAWSKVKHRDTIEVICGAVTGTRSRPRELIVGLPTDHGLDIVGRTTPLTAAVARHLAEQLQPSVGHHPWPTVLTSGALHRFAGGRQETPVTLVEPIVIEVAADVATTGGSFRHAVRFIRTRPELAPADIRPVARAS